MTDSKGALAAEAPPAPNGRGPPQTVRKSKESEAGPIASTAWAVISLGMSRHSAPAPVTSLGSSEFVAFPALVQRENRTRRWEVNTVVGSLFFAGLTAVFLFATVIALGQALWLALVLCLLMAGLGFIGTDLNLSAFLLYPRESTWRLDADGLRFDWVRSPRVIRTGGGVGRSILMQLPIRWLERGNPAGRRYWAWPNCRVHVAPDWGIVHQKLERVWLVIWPSEIRGGTGIRFGPLSNRDAATVLTHLRAHGARIDFKGVEHPERLAIPAAGCRSASGNLSQSLRP